MKWCRSQVTGFMQLSSSVPARQGKGSFPNQHQHRTVVTIRSNAYLYTSRMFVCVSERYCVCAIEFWTFLSVMNQRHLIHWHLLRLLNYIITYASVLFAIILKRFVSKEDTQTLKSFVLASCNKQSVVEQIATALLPENANTRPQIASCADAIISLFTSKNLCK